MATQTFSAGLERAPTLREIELQREALGDLVRETPVWQWRGGTPAKELGQETEVFLKLELFQAAGSFKPRGALSVMLGLDSKQLSRGVVAVSAGNHALATAYAAQVVGTTAKLIMPQSANPARVSGCQQFRGEVLQVGDIASAFELAKQIQHDEGRHFVHPFEGPMTAIGTATLGLEFARQVPDLDAVIIPIGGGGLCAGVATAFKAIQPRCRVIGVEPKGADSMHRSFATGKPESLRKIQTIADSLGAPHAAPYSLKLCQDSVDELVLIDDRMMCGAMAHLFRDMKLVCEPAAAAATAAMIGPLRYKLREKRVGVVVCGSNIDLGSFVRYVDAGLSGIAPTMGIRPRPSTIQPPGPRAPRAAPQTVAPSQGETPTEPPPAG